MARRRTFTSALIKAYGERQKARQQARRDAERHAEKVLKEQERRVAQESKEQQRREVEAERARRREETRVEQARKQDERKARDVAAVQRRQLERLARERREQDARDKRERADERQAEADTLTTELRAHSEALDRLLADRRRDLVSHRRAVDDVFAAHGAQRMVDVVCRLVASSSLPDGFPAQVEGAYRPENAEFIVRRDFPGQDVVPSVQAYKYVRSRDVIEPARRKDAEVRTGYEAALARLTLRTLAEIFDATSPTLVQRIGFNGYVDTRDKATGKAIRPCLVSVSVARETFDDLVLDELDPSACLRHINALVSPHPYDFEAVRPVVEFDLSRYTFVEEVDVVSGLDGRTNLLDLTPGEFEHLVKDLFVARGMKGWVTQSSRDEGVDAVATIEEPLMRGKCIIQAKRYSRIVGAESVYALAGTMAEHQAMKGILVTTSWVGQASLTFASNHRIDIIDGRNLKALLKKYLDKDVRIGLPKVPPGWERRDIT